MQSLFQSASNTATTGKAIYTGGGNIEVKKLVVGAPVASANIWLFDENAPGNSTVTSGLEMKLTLPASLATGQLPFVIDLTDEQGHGLTLQNGGAVYIDQTLQLTVLWDVAVQPTGGAV